MIGPWQVPGQGGVAATVGGQDTVKLPESILKLARDRADSGDTIRNSQSGQLAGFVVLVDSSSLFVQIVAYENLD